MLPGEHLVVIGREMAAIRARLSGLQLRDTLLILLPGGTSLFAYLFRRPVESTIIENVLKYGVGGLNIDGCRITTRDNLNGGAYSGGGRTADLPGAQRSQSAAGMFAEGAGRLPGEFEQPSGRWPTNLLLVHGPGCKQVGTKKVPGYADPDGLETIPNWDCQPDCPVRLLDEQSGQIKSAYPGNPEGAQAKYGQPVLNPKRGNCYAPGLDTKPCGVLYSDSGGASRFYPQFPDLPAALEWLQRLVAPSAPASPAAPPTR